MQSSSILFEHIHFNILVAWSAHSLPIALSALFIFRSVRAHTLSSYTKCYLLYQHYLSVLIAWLEKFCSFHVLNIYYILCLYIAFINFIHSLHTILYRHSTLNGLITKSAPNNPHGVSTKSRYYLPIGSMNCGFTFVYNSPHKDQSTQWLVLRDHPKVDPFQHEVFVLV